MRQELVIDAGACLLNPRVLIVAIEIEDRRLRHRRPGGQGGVDGRVDGDQVARERDRLDVDAVVRVGRADHDRWRPAVKHAVARARDVFLSHRAPCDPEPGTKVVGVGRQDAGVDVRRPELRVGVPDLRFREPLDVVTQPRIQGEIGPQPPFVLREPRVLLDIGMRRRTRGTGTRECLHVSACLIPVEGGEARKRVGAEEVAREVVEDVVELEIESGFHSVCPARPRDRVGSLPPFDRRLTRAERVASDSEDRRAVLLDEPLRIAAVGFTGLLIACPLEPNLVEERRRDDGSEAGIQRARSHVRVAGVLDRVLRAAVLEILAVEILMVVPQRQAVGRVQLVIGLDEEHVLVLRLVPAAGKRLQLGNGGLRVGIGGCARRQVEEHEIRQRVPLAVIVREEEIAVLAQRSPEQAAELIVVIRRFGSSLQLVDQVDRVQRLVAIELEELAGRRVRARFGHHVDYRTAGPAVLGRVRIRVHLELFHGGRAELVGGAARPGAADRLSEERVVVVGAVDDEAVEGAALAGKADVAGTHVGSDAGCEQREVDEVAAIDREIADGRFVDRRAHLRPRRLDDRRFAGDGDGLGDVRHAHFEAQRDGRADGQLDVRLSRRREALKLGRDVVRADREQLASKGAGGISDDPGDGCCGRLGAECGDDRQSNGNDGKQFLHGLLLYRDP